MEEEGQVNCSNCNKPQVASKIHLHEAYCLRNIRKCPDCDEYIDKRELETHKQEKHTQQQCKYCSQGFLPKDMDSHLKQCILRPQKCPYCTLDIPGIEYGEHVKDCGSRTKECFICNKSIILFNFDDHINTCVGAEDVPYESQFPSHTQAFKPKPNQNKPQIFKPYLPGQTNVAASRVHIGGTGSQAKKDTGNDQADEDFARRLQMAEQNNDTDLLKKLQEEEDERLARELNKDFSPKNKQAQNIPKPPVAENKPASHFDEYDYNYEDDNENDYHGFDEEDIEKEQEEMRQAQQYQQGLNNPLVFPQYQKPATQEKSSEVKEMEELGEFIEDDPELQQAIFQSQQHK